MRASLSLVGGKATRCLYPTNAADSHSWRRVINGEFKEGETREGWIAARLDQERQKRKEDGLR